MEIPLQEIFALVSYIHADMENGVQLNPEWEEAVEKVRVWAVACQQSVQADKCRTGLPHVFKWDGTLNTPEMLECENCGIRR